MTAFKIEPGSSHDTTCDCCNQQSRTVSGFVYGANDTTAVYFVHWTLGGVDTHGAHFDLIIGKWGDGTTPSDRSAVALEFRRTEQGPAFMVIDASQRPAGRSELAGRALSRDVVVGTPLAKLAFDLVDAVWVHDSRIREIVQDAD